MADREIALFEDGVEYYRGKLSVNECYFRAKVSKDILVAVGKAPTKFSLSVSNGKKKGSEEWLPNTFVNCLAWGDLGKQISDRYSDKDEIEVIGKYAPHKYNNTTYPEFIVREIIRMKPEDSQPTYAGGGSNYEEVPQDSDLPF